MFCLAVLAALAGKQAQIIDILQVEAAEELDTGEAAAEEQETPPALPCLFLVEMVHPV